MSNIKTLSAVVGGSAIVAMGALAVAVTEQGSGTIVSDPGTFTSPVTSSMTTGETSTEVTTEPTRSPASAAPPVTATTPEAP